VEEKMEISKFFTGVFALSAMLVACGDDSTSAKDTDRSEEVYSDVVVETFDDLPVCSDNREGSIAYVKDVKTAYVCEDGKWSEKVPEVESSGSKVVSSATSEEESSSSEITSSASEEPESSGSEPTSSALEEPGSSSSSGEVSSSSSEPESSSQAIINNSSGSSTLCNELPGGVCDYGTLIDLRDGKKYKTVTIGDQTWMAENLNYAYTGVPYNYSGYTSDSTSWCYDNDPANCAKYGRLYTWAAAIDSVKLATDADNPLDCGDGKECGLAGKVQGICPEGWHLPSTTVFETPEFETLFTAVGGKSPAGTALKSTSGWNEYEGKSGNGTDAFGFSALPAGVRNYDGGYSGEGAGAVFWSSTGYDSNFAYYMALSDNFSLTELNPNTKNNGFSVRCLKD